MAPKQNRLTNAHNIAIFALFRMAKTIAPPIPAKAIGNNAKKTLMASFLFSQIILILTNN